MRLIDADALPKYTGYALSAAEVANAVENAPTVDAIEVVRCKDCKHYEDNRCSLLEYFFHKEDDYCSWGAKMDETDRKSEGI